jgi:ATP-dependent Clp endopeptidase proteolytic subunit ClpP
MEAEAEGAELDTQFQRRNNERELAEAREALVYTFAGVVGDKTVGDAMTQLGEWSRRFPEAPITVILNTPGGGVFQGLALYDYLLELRAGGHRVTTVTRGFAASMGSVLLQAGDERVVGPNAYVMIHEVSKMDMGKLSELEDSVAFSKRLYRRLLEILAERSEMNADQIKRKAHKYDWWLDAQEAVEKGFADRIE